MKYDAPPAQLDVLARELCAERERAVSGRRNQGLDDIWAKAREQYQGIDDVNRKGRIGNAQTLDGPLTSFQPSVGAEYRSTVFVNMTRPYTDTGTSQIADFSAPVGKLPWALEPTPVPDIELIGQAVRRDPKLAETLRLFPDLESKLADSAYDQSEAVTRAETLIKDWFRECKWLREFRTFINEMGLVGTGVMDGPHPKRRKVSAEVESFVEIAKQVSPILGKELEMQLLYAPVSECLKVENCFPDPACGTDIQNGRFFFKRVTDVSPRQMREFADDPSYFSDQILACLDEGPKSKGVFQKKDKGFDLWFREGMVKLSQLRDPEEDNIEEVAGDEMVFLDIVLCNDRIIKISEPLLDDEKFRKQVVTWSKRDGSWAGIGIPELIETPQRGLNASMRALQDNLAFSVGPQVVIRDGVISPEDGDPRLTPYKRWKAVIDGISTQIDDVEKAITLLEFPNYTPDLLPLINHWMKLIEDTSALPMVLQGQSATDAVGVSQQLQNNATTNLRLIVKELDEDCIVPQVLAYFDWAQTYGPPDVKCDATVVALGSATLITRELQQQALLQIGDRVLQPSYGISPEKWMATFLEGHQLDAEKLALSPEEREKLEAAESAPDPKVQVAQIEAEADKYDTDKRVAVDIAKLDLDAKIKGAKLDQDGLRLVADTELKGQENVIKEEQVLAKAGEAAPAPTNPEPSIDSMLDQLGFGEEPVG